MNEPTRESTPAAALEMGCSHREGHHEVLLNTPTNWSVSLYEAVHAWRPLVRAHLSGFGNSGIEDVLADAHLIAWRSLGDRWDDNNEGHKQVGRIVRVLAMRARTRATRDRLAVTSLEECATLPATTSVRLRATSSTETLIEGLPKVLSPTEARLLKEILRHDGDVDEAVRVLDWSPRRIRQARQMIAATATTMSKALRAAESGEHITAMGCLPASGPWKDALNVSGRPNPHLLLGVSVSRWRRIRGEAEALMQAARIGLSTAAPHVLSQGKAA